AGLSFVQVPCRVIALRRFERGEDHARNFGSEGFFHWRLTGSEDTFSTTMQMVCPRLRRQPGFLRADLSCRAAYPRADVFDWLFLASNWFCWRPWSNSHL